MDAADPLDPVNPDANRAPGRYTRTAIVLHWLIAALIVGNVVLGWCFDVVPDDSIRTVIDTHKAIGLTVFGLVLMRILWRLGHPPPPLPTGYARWERAAAHVVHGLLYLLMLALPLTGWLHDSAWKAAQEIPLRWFGLFEVPRFGPLMNAAPEVRERLHGVLGTLHMAFAGTLVAAFVLHVAGALKHQWLDRAPSLARMGLGRR